MRGPLSPEAVALLKQLVGARDIAERQGKSGRDLHSVARGRGGALLHLPNGQVLYHNEDLIIELLIHRLIYDLGGRYEITEAGHALMHDNAEPRKPSAEEPF